MNPLIQIPNHDKGGLIEKKKPDGAGCICDVSVNSFEARLGLELNTAHALLVLNTRVWLLLQKYIYHYFLWAETCCAPIAIEIQQALSIVCWTEEVQNRLSPHTYEKNCFDNFYTCGPVVDRDRPPCSVVQQPFFSPFQQYRILHPLRRACQ